MTKVSAKDKLNDTHKLNIKKQEILQTISSMRQSLKIGWVRKAIDPEGQLLKRLNQTKKQLPHMTLMSEMRETDGLLKDFQKPIERAMGKKGPFEKMPLA